MADNHAKANEEQIRRNQEYVRAAKERAAQAKAEQDRKETEQKATQDKK